MINIIFIIQMRLHQSVDIPNQQSSAMANSNRFVIRYSDSQLKSLHNNKKRRRQQQKDKHDYQGLLQKKLLAQSSIFSKSKKKKKDMNLNLQTQSSISGQIRKRNVNILKRTESIDHIQQLNRQKQIQKEYSKVPIDYYDEQANGSPVDKMRGRVVYRGYAPKNTYFYLKTIKDYKISANQPNTMRHDYELKFNSKFQCGNLLAAVRVSSKEYWLNMRQDTNTHGLRQWYFFQVINRKPVNVKFRIYKFSKNYSLYKQGMKPFVKSEQKGLEWSQAGQNVKYQYDVDMKSHYLEFQYNFETANSETYFATLPPYSYSDMLGFVETVKEMSDDVSIRTLGKSLAGLDIPIIDIISRNKKNNNHSSGFYSYRESNQDKNQKQAIIVMARTHPGQTVSNFALEDFVYKILQSDVLMQKYNFFIIPMVNPDGVYLGNHRTGAIGMDLNRCFNSCDPEVFPEVNLIINQVSRIKKQYKIRFLLDLHGHSAKRNIFAYGEQHQIGSQKYLLSRVLPKLLSDTISTFKYDYSVFRAAKEKKNTARVYFSNLYQINSITFQQSYGLISEGAICIQHWRNFGIALAESLVQFTKMINQENSIQSIAEYLKQQVQRQQQKREKRIQKQKRLLEGFKIVQSSSSKVLQNQQKSKQLKRLKSNPEDEKNQRNTQEDLQKVAEHEQQQQQENSSINSQELSSGDQQLEINDEQLQEVRKDIVRVGCMKQGVKRELFNMADKRLQLQSYDYTSQPRLHQQKSNMVSRILKLQMNRKLTAGNANILYGPPGTNAYGYRPMNSQRNSSIIQLPSIKR